MNMLQHNDYSQLINITDFRFLINHQPCDLSGRNLNSSSIILIVLIHSSIANWERRMAIRHTYGNWINIPRKNVNINIFFVFGKPLKPEHQEIIARESQMFGDIIQGNFIDTYHNLTYKHVSCLKWFTYFCPQADYLLKMDDDTFFNAPTFLKFLKDSRIDDDLILREKNYIMCRNGIGSAIRDQKSKWFVSKDEYSVQTYPRFCTGAAILYSNDVVVKLYEKAQNTTYFWIDDVHVTGIIRSELKQNLTQSAKYILDEKKVIEIIEKHGRKRYFGCGGEDQKGDKFLFVMNVNPKNMHRFWRAVSCSFP